MSLYKLIAQLSLIVALLVTQYGAVVHASIHDFHEHEASCDVFQAAERAADTVVQDVATVFVRLPTFFQHQITKRSCEQVSPNPRSRSPPKPFLIC